MRDCKWGSVPTSWQTSASTLAIPLLLGRVLSLLSNHVCKTLAKSCCFSSHATNIYVSSVEHFFTRAALLCSLLSLLILLYNSMSSSCTFGYGSICYNFGHAPDALLFPPIAPLCTLLHFRAPPIALLFPHYMFLFSPATLLPTLTPVM